MPSVTEIAKLNKHVYEKKYKVSQGAINRDESTYSYQLVKFRLDLIKQFGKNKDVLDLCCGAGDYLLDSAEIIKSGIGIDFSDQMIAAARQKKASNLQFIQGDATKLPFKNNQFDLIFSFSSLYYIPDIDRTVAEIGRVLKPGGQAILDFGNLYSLNTIVCKSHPEVAFSCHIPIKKMYSMLQKNNLSVQSRSSFQLLPLWGAHPWYLKPLLLPAWTKVAKINIKGQMLDQRVSNLPIINKLAFRQIIVCQKAGGK